jgi:hypothetical protein
MKKLVVDAVEHLENMNSYSKKAMNATAILALLLMLISAFLLVFAPLGNEYYTLVFYFEKTMECSRAVFIAGLIASFICDILYKDKVK